MGFPESQHEQCLVPPLGWSCSRPAGHEGPCAASPTPEPQPTGCFLLLYKPPCGEWYAHSHKLYPDRATARAKAAKFLEPGTPISIVHVGYGDVEQGVEYVG